MVWGFLVGSGMLTLIEYHSHARLRFKLGCWDGGNLGHGMGYSSGVPTDYDVHCSVVLALVVGILGRR